MTAQTQSVQPEIREVWKPSVTVAAVIERDGKFLLVEEETGDGLRFNQPAGHLDECESPLQGVAREALEETAYEFTPTNLLGIYLARTRSTTTGLPVTYLRFAFTGALGKHHPEQALDDGILRAVWMTPEEIRATQSRHRSPLILQCVEDYLRGQSYPLDLIYTHPSVMQAEGIAL